MPSHEQPFSSSLGAMRCATAWFEALSLEQCRALVLAILFPSVFGVLPLRVPFLLDVVATENLRRTSGNRGSLQQTRAELQGRWLLEGASSTTLSELQSFFSLRMAVVSDARSCGDEVPYSSYFLACGMPSGEPPWPK